MNNSSDDRTEESTSGITRAGESGHPSEGVPGLNKIPRGTEMLVKRASVDPAFRQALIERRADVARDIGLVLTMAESVMLDAIPSAQLEGSSNMPRCRTRSARPFSAMATTRYRLRPHRAACSLPPWPTEREASGPTARNKLGQGRPSQVSRIWEAGAGEGWPLLCLTQF